MQDEREDVEGLRKSRLSGWKSTIRRSLACGASRSISKRYPMEWAREKFPAVAEEVNSARDRAHQDVLETLQKMGPTSPDGQDQHASHTVWSCVASTPRPLVSADSASDAPTAIPPGPRPGPSPPPSPRPAPEAQRPQGTGEQLSPPPPPPPPPPLEALLYFAVERPNRGGFIRHYHRPLRLGLSTPRARAAAARTLRGYLTDQPGRFLSHFGLAHRRRGGGGGGLAVCVSQLSSSSSSSSCRLRARVEGTWGLGATWADAREAAFAPALVGLLWESAAGRAAGAEAPTVDVCVVVRQMGCHGGRGEEERCYEMGWELDVRRVARDVVEPAAEAV